MYKVGDKVRVRTDLENGKWYGTLVWLGGMNEFKGKEYTVTRVEGNYYNLDGVNGCISPWWFSHEMLEPVEERRRVEVEEKYINDLMVKIETLEKEIKELKGEELLPCPFCGGKAIWWETDDAEYPYQIICRECRCGTDECDNRQGTIDDWNRRV